MYDPFIFSIVEMSARRVNFINRVADLPIKKSIIQILMIKGAIIRSLYLSPILTNCRQKDIRRRDISELFR